MSSSYLSDPSDVVVACPTANYLPRYPFPSSPPAFYPSPPFLAPPPFPFRPPSPFTPPRPPMVLWWALVLCACDCHTIPCLPYPMWRVIINIGPIHNNKEELGQ